MTPSDPSRDPLLKEVEALRARLEEAQDIVRAIRAGEVDAVVVGEPQSERVYTLASADRPYRAMIEQMRQSAVIVSADAVVLYANRRLAELVDEPLEGVIGSSLLRFLDESGGGRLAACLERAKGGAAGEEELTLRAEGGATVPVHMTASVMPDDAPGFCLVITDLAERRIREALTFAEGVAERYRLLVEGATGFAIMYLDTAGRVTTWNVGAERLFGYIDSEILGEHFSRFFTPEDLADGRPARELRQARHNERADDDNELVRKDGGRFWASGATTALRDESGRLKGYAKIVRDVSARKQAEQERDRLLAEARAAREEAMAANRMKDEFLATLSHELRTPLNAVVGWARILRSGPVDADDLEEGLAAIDRNAKVQAQLIEDLLDVSRIISGTLRLEVQRVNLAEVIEAALAAVAPAAEAKGVRISKVLDPPAGQVSGDPARLQQVIWNLLANAVKFTPQGGQVQVLLERVNSHVEVSVIDTGQGIAPEFLPHVFDRFRQADGTTTRRHGGLGLGLSIVKQLVEMHGGSVRAKSPGDGSGSTFAVALPITVVHPEPPAREPIRLKAGESAEPDCSDHPLRGIRVLVVDDEPDARRLVERVLAECGGEVRVAASVFDARAALEGFEPDVLVSDIGMPDQDGYDLIRQVRASGRTAKEFPAVALTAFARAEDRKRAMLAGFQAHVAKPVDPAELVAVVASLVGRTGVA